MKDTVVEYTDIVLAVHEAVKDVTEDNKCDFHINLSLMLEGLEEDVNEVEAGETFGCRPKEVGDDS